MIKKIFVALLLFFIPLMVIAKPLQNITLVLDWFLNPDHAPIIVAEQQGFFKQVGLHVHLVTPADPSDGPKLVAANRAEIAITYQPELMLAINRDLPLIRFATLINQPLECLITLKNGPIHSVLNLKNKRIGFSINGIQEVMLKTMLNKYHLQLSDVRLMNVRYDLVQALLTGRIDGFSGGQRNFETIQLTLLGKPNNCFKPEKNDFPSYDEFIFVTNKTLAHDPRLKSFVVALQRGVEYLKQHPQQSWDLFAKNHPELNNPLNHQAWLASLPFFDIHPGQLNAKKYQAFTDFLYKKQMIKQTFPLTLYAENIY